ncbi:MAG: D-cysteine desulfhydrase family protein [Anaerovoracaceae bacterium]
MNKVTDGIKRISLGCFPTPLKELGNIGKEFKDNQKVYIKRDDMTGISLGGNKVRKLEYILAEAIENGYDTIITTGGAQSNHATITAACCRKLGLDVRLVLQGEGVMDTKGNLLLDDIMDVPVEFVMSSDFRDVYSRIKEVCNELEQKGKKPYSIPVGGSMGIGVLGYIDGMYELFDQLMDEQKEKLHIVSCTGSGGTLAGIILGAKLISPKTKVTGILIGEDLSCKDGIMKLIEESCQILGIKNPVSLEDIVIKEYYGAGYAIPSKMGNDAIKKLAKTEGIFVDPVYTGKTFGGILDLNKNGYFDNDENIVFIHSGGAAALFAISME